MPFYAQHIKAARLHLQKCDPVFKRLLKQVGPFTAKAKRDRFGTLVNSIISQQISVAAAATIRARLLESFSPDPITPTGILGLKVEQLRELGVSRQKASYLLDLADKVDSGVVALDKIHLKEDDEIIEEMVQVKGIGPWTAQMFMMFSLARMDVRSSFITISRNCQIGRRLRKPPSLGVPTRPSPVGICGGAWSPTRES